MRKCLSLVLTLKFTSERKLRRKRLLCVMTSPSHLLSACCGCAADPPRRRWSQQEAGATSVSGDSLVGLSPKLFPVAEAADGRGGGVLRRGFWTHGSSRWSGEREKVGSAAARVCRLLPSFGRSELSVQSLGPDYRNAAARKGPFTRGLLTSEFVKNTQEGFARFKRGFRGGFWVFQQQFVLPRCVIQGDFIPSTESACTRPAVIVPSKPPELLLHMNVIRGNPNPPVVLGARAHEG